MFNFWDYCFNQAWIYFHDNTYITPNELSDVQSDIRNALQTQCEKFYFINAELPIGAHYSAYKSGNWHTITTWTGSYLMHVYAIGKSWKQKTHSGIVNHCYIKAVDLMDRHWIGITNSEYDLINFRRIK